MAQICPMQESKKKRSNLSPPLKLNKSASRLLPQAFCWSSAGSSAAVLRLFCARKLGRSLESSCYSRNSLGFFFSPSPLPVSFLPITAFLPPPPVLISLISPERKRCLAYCSSEGEETALPFSFISSPTGVMFVSSRSLSATAVSFHKVAFG